jgi:type II pantothenate kinase
MRSHQSAPSTAGAQRSVRAAIDFGISNTDAVAVSNGERTFWTRESRGAPDHDTVRMVLAAGAVTLDGLPSLAVTGGRHRMLPAMLGSCEVIAVPEVSAIGRGGQALGMPDVAAEDTSLLVVSAGSGTAVVSARGVQYAHITGTGVGGGTLLGLGRLLLGTTDVHLIDAMAMRGDPNGVDLALRDVVSGPIGSLPADATAVNFGRLARQTTSPHPDDLAAALLTLIGQVIAVTAINAARAERLEHVVVIGHMTDMPSFRRVLEQVGTYYGMRLMLPANAGFGTALGALLHGAGESA